MDNPIEFFRKYAVISGTGSVKITVSDKHIPYNDMCELLENVKIKIVGSTIFLEGSQIERNLSFEDLFECITDPKILEIIEERYIQYTSILETPYAEGWIEYKERIPYQLISSTFTLISI